MTLPQTAGPIQGVLSRLSDVRKSGTGWSARCPAHEDRSASLSVAVGDDGRVLLHCHAGCEPAAVARALGLELADLFPACEHAAGNGRRPSPRRAAATYDYTDRQGRLLFQVVRYDPKGFCQRRPDGKGGWAWNLGNTPRVPYRLPGLLAAPADVMVYVAEGEKDCDNLARLGLVATTNPQGAGKWDKLDPGVVAEAFRGRSVVILPDNDEPGRAHADDVARSLRGTAASVKVLSLPGLPPKGDVTDWLAAGGTREELERLAAGCPGWEPRPQPDDRGESEYSRGDSWEPPEPAAEPPWPDPPSPEAYHGLAGDIVSTLAPETEADPVALLAQLLAGFGSAVGRLPFFQVEADRHYLNLFVNLVGQTSKARKGTSWGRVRLLFELADREWADRRVVGGLSSGEGLIWAVRDPIMAREKLKERGRVTGFQEYEADPGEPDKRLLVHEPEFAVVLRQIERTGNTLSALIRQAWETGNLRTLTKNSPAKATGAHVAIVGHITAEELRRYLSTTEAASGFGNRFIWLCVRRSKCLPEGGRPVDVGPLVARLSQALAFARGVGQMTRDDAARKAWAGVYPSLSDGKPGLAGALIGRGEAQVTRLSCLYALLDLSAVVRPEHLLAALALWEYAERSVLHVFGDSLGDPLADEIMAALRGSPDGLTRTDISNLCGRNESRGRIARALGLLLHHRRAQVTREKTDGRPVERWTVAAKRPSAADRPKEAAATA
jgi:hypothetical protein